MLRRTMQGLIFRGPFTQHGRLDDYKHVNRGNGIDADKMRMSDPATAVHLKDFASKLRLSDPLRYRPFLSEFQALKDAGHEVGERTACVVLKLLIEMDRPRIAEKFFADMKSSAPKIMSLYAINIMFQLYARARNADAQAVLLDYMHERGHDPNLVTFTEVIKCQVLLGNKGAAVDAFDEAKRRNLPLDELVYGVMIQACTPAEAEELLKEMEARQLNAHADGIQHALIQCCSNTKDTKQAERYFARISQPGRQAFRGLLWVYKCAGDVSGAWRVLRRAKESGVQLTTDTLRVFVKLCIAACESGAATPMTREQCLEACDAIARSSKPQYPLNRELIHLAVAAGDDQRVRRHVGVHITAGLGMTQTIRDLIARSGIPFNEDVFDGKYNRGRDMPIWMRPDRGAPQRGDARRPSGQPGRRSPTVHTG